MSVGLRGGFQRRRVQDSLPEGVDISDSMGKMNGIASMSVNMVKGKACQSGNSMCRGAEVGQACFAGGRNALDPPRGGAQGTLPAGGSRSITCPPVTYLGVFSSWRHALSLGS